MEMHTGGGDSFGGESRVGQWRVEGGISCESPGKLILQPPPPGWERGRCGGANNGYTRIYDYEKFSGKGGGGIIVEVNGML